MLPRDSSGMCDKRGAGVGAGGKGSASQGPRVPGRYLAFLPWASQGGRWDLTRRDAWQKETGMPTGRALPPWSAPQPPCVSCSWKQILGCSEFAPWSRLYRANQIRHSVLVAKLASTSLTDPSRMLAFWGPGLGSQPSKTFPLDRTSKAKDTARHTLTQRTGWSRGPAGWPSANLGTAAYVDAGPRHP